MQQHHRVSVNGAVLDVIDCGTASMGVVVLHPSLGRHAADFDRLLADLSGAGYRCLAIDPRGVGSSTAVQGEVTLRSCAEDLWAVVDQLGLGRVHLLGHAFGNRVCRMASTMRPAQVRSIVLLSAGGEIHAAADDRAALQRCFDLTLPIEQRRASIRQAFFAPGNDPSVWDGGWYPAAAAAQMKAIQHAKLEDWWAGGTAPMLAVQGLDDVMAPPQNGWNLAARRPNTHVVGLTRCGHAMLPERPVAIADLVRWFLRSPEG